MSNLVELDGAQGEGGGQILRTSMALALITGKPFHLRNLRAGRSKPGLQPQHLMSVQAAAAVGQAKARGATLGSTDLVFEPGPVQSGHYHFKIGTAGATGLVLHTIYLPLALSGGPSTVTIEGGTHVKAAPCFHFLQITWRAYLEVLGISLNLEMRRPGFYPRGGGLITASIAPCSAVLALQIGTLRRIHAVRAFSAVAGLPDHVQRRQAERLRHRLRGLGLAASVAEESWQGGPSTVVGIELPTEPAPTTIFGLGERGKPAERVADEAVTQLARFLAADPPGIDEHSADQLVLPLALARGASRFPVASVSSHLQTNVDVIRHFLDRTITVEGRSEQPGWVTVAAD